MMNNSNNSRIRLVREDRAARDNSCTSLWIVIAVTITLILSRTSVLADLLSLAQALLSWYILGMIVLLMMMFTGYVNNWFDKLLYTVCSPVLKLVYRLSPIKSRKYWLNPVVSIALLLIVRHIVMILL